ncbi:CDP-diacylglycerol diphosphatase [Mycobacterium sp. Aquia_216]|uniref:CDP-diacylglycerol diphosphatase n=1 Tax=Mycobacterium sp. Aquia_216 TaxID=2991729 RepID=UPI00227D1851|nr:CDP-diacylglycerol diphosphatase [Mycobacterium sp. Aquia_216]WAJ45971.1 CDP-diacylglycerol diphosphatase [Mycobacterium sp. Aquia_216]
MILTVPLASDGANSDADPNVLWAMVNQCVTDERDHHDPTPCVEVELNSGYSVLKDSDGATQFLAIADTRITGIESPQLLRPGTPNYFADAWQARSWVERTVGRSLPRDWISLAINSVQGRTQNQLHIHIDCVRADVRQILIDRAADISSVWAPLPMPLAGHTYSAVRVVSENLDLVNPFKVLADGLAGARADMGSQTLAVVGTFFDKRPEFVLLADHADAATGDTGSSEELQDHTSCPPTSP